MDDYEAKAFYKREIEEMIEDTADLGLLDLVYKILVEAKK